MTNLDKNGYIDLNRKCQNCFYKALTKCVYLCQDFSVNYQLQSTRDQEEFHFNATIFYGYY